jgi:YidC/Oxa1 family membrane protein insertase
MNKMDIKRTIMWVIFAMSLLMLWDNWMLHTGKPSMFAPASKSQAVQATQAKQVASSSASAIAAASQQNASITSDGTAPDVDAAPAFVSETISIATDVFKVDFDTLGGDIKRLELLQYKEAVHHDHWYDLFLELFGVKEKKIATKNVVLFNQDALRTYLAQTGLVGTGFPNHQSAYVLKSTGRQLDANGQLQLVFEAENAGVKLVKTYTFKKSSYLIDVNHEVINQTTAAITPSLYMQLRHDGTKPTSGSMFTGTAEFYAPAVYTDKKHFEKLDFEKIGKYEDEKEGSSNELHVSQADNGWVSVIQHFFVSAYIPPNKMARDIYTQKVGNNLYTVGSKLALGTIAPGASTSLKAQLYSGPQETVTLEKIAPGLDLVKDYWYFSMIAKPMFWVMQLLHNIIGNWGWTIVVFTILIKLALFPLSAAGYRSMAKMKLVTPKMTALRERHKNEPQKLNQAMMELYKTEKINPLGGCLPILIQMPVFLSLYWVLQASVEMRGAPWVGWITDLSQPDPWLILPILYAISMFITTKLSPAPADPMQAKMMLFMPLMFSVMFFFFPSGLVLYWVVNNILSIGQQWVINNKLIPPEHR